jgi:hypothetical protein
VRCAPRHRVIAVCVPVGVAGFRCRFRVREYPRAVKDFGPWPVEPSWCSPGSALRIYGRQDEALSRFCDWVALTSLHRTASPNRGGRDADERSCCRQDRRRVETSLSAEPRGSDRGGSS